MRILPGVVALFLCLGGCDIQGSDDLYTLYRGSPAGPLRIHVATFDADESNGYNFENCRQTARLFKDQPGVTVEYWCEKGKYRK